MDHGHRRPPTECWPDRVNSEPGVPRDRQETNQKSKGKIARWQTSDWWNLAVLWLFDVHTSDHAHHRPPTDCLSGHVNLIACNNVFRLMLFLFTMASQMCFGFWGRLGTRGDGGGQLGHTRGISVAHLGKATQGMQIVGTLQF